MLMKTLLATLTFCTALSVSAGMNPEDLNFEKHFEVVAPTPRIEPEDFGSSRPARGTYACYVRGGNGKLYGPGPESRSRAKASSAALARCGKMTKGKCSTAYCDSL